MIVYGRGVGWLFGLYCVLSGCMVEDPRESGVIVVDPQALSANPTIEQYEQARSANALPMLVDTEMPITVRTRDATRSFSVGYGELVRVHGPELTISRSLLDHDVARDRLEIDGPRVTVEEIAAQISATLSPRGLGSYQLDVANVFVHLAQLDPADVREVRPVALASANDAVALSSSAALSGLRDLDHGGALIAGEADAASAEADPVGVYQCGDGALSLDASNRFHSCTLGAGHYRLQGQQLTLDSSHGSIVLQLDRDGSLRDREGSSCSLATLGDTP